MSWRTSATSGLVDRRRAMAPAPTRSSGIRPLDEIAASDIEALQRQITATARRRRTSRRGRHAGEHVVAAARAVYTKAIADGLIGPGARPAHRVPKPRRLPSTRPAPNPDA